MSAFTYHAFDSVDAMLQCAWQVMEPVWKTENNHPTGIVLSGGSTPLPLYKRIADFAQPAAPMLHLILADERMISEESDQCNYTHMRAMVDACGLEKRVLRPQFLSEENIPQSAHLYHQQLDQFWIQNGRIPLGFFGLGPDGHTASLFTLEAARSGSQSAGSQSAEWAIPVMKELPPHRVSITPACIQKIERCIFLVAGEDKRDIVTTLFQAPETIPAGLAMKNNPRVEVWTAFTQG